MSIDSHTRPDAAVKAAAAPVIENEIPSYRALSPLAVTALISGLVSMLSFAHPMFLGAAVLAVIFGVLALRKIKRQPDLFTGEGLATAGVVLGLVCGLSSVTYSAVQRLLMNRRAEMFVRNNILDTLKKGDVDAALWYRLQPTARGNMSPEQVRKQFETPGQRPDPMMQMSEIGPINQIAKLLARPNADLRLVRIEQLDWEGVTPVALALLEINAPPDEAEEKAHEGANHDHAHDHGPKFGAILIKSDRDGREEDWWVDRYIYPYTPNSYVAEVKPVDDGHGHGPGQH